MNNTFEAIIKVKIDFKKLNEYIDSIYWKEKKYNDIKYKEMLQKVLDSLEELRKNFNSTLDIEK